MCWDLVHVGKAAATAAWADSSLFSTCQHFCYLMVWFGVIWDFLRLCVLTCLIWGISHQWAENPPLVFGWVFWFVFFFVCLFCFFVLLLPFWFFFFLLSSFLNQKWNLILVLLRMNLLFGVFPFIVFPPLSKGKKQYIGHKTWEFVPSCLMYSYTDISNCSRRNGSYFEISWCFPAHSEAGEYQCWSNCKRSPARLFIGGC